MKKAGSFDQNPNIGFVIATKRVAEDEQKACFMYREEPMDAQDSGWRIFAGDESQAYVDNPENSGIYTPAAILMVDDSIADLLNEPYGSAFEREDGTGEWQVAEGFGHVMTDELAVRELEGGWRIVISGLFEQHEEDEGDTVFVAEGRTVRLAIWDFSDKGHEQVIEIHRAFIGDRDQSQAPTLESFDFEEDGIIRLGFVVEESDDEHSYKVLYGYTIIGNEVAQGAYYYDLEDDREWALATWKSVRIEQASEIFN